jgi:exopolysaccharide biosynthesis polyprenyl glycosylphosphotransferase
VSAAKRAFDVALAGAGLGLSWPLGVLIAALVKLEDGGPVFFAQTRVGRGGVRFRSWKFRSMRPDAEARFGPRQAAVGDARVTRVGRVLRSTAMDELPQLWNILRGDMTLVGPRPERPYFVDRFSAEFDRYAHRHRVQAGLTGLAQVSGLRGDTSIADRTRYDNYYIEHWSLWLDIKIVIRTFSEIFYARGR